METIKKVRKELIDKVYKNRGSFLALEKFGRSKNISDYSEEEINEMILGIYRHKMMLLVDGDYFIDMNKVIRAECELVDVSYLKKLSLEDYKNNLHNSLSNIRTFYVKDYFLVTDHPEKGIEKHKITRFLSKVGFLKKGRGKNSTSFSIANTYDKLLFGEYPKDLYHPIKHYINGLFFNDDYYITDFEINSSFEFIK
ncbi:hypothetical protein [Moheibacter lacus]|uniref:Uncharacterized protein n=1 Tax=Moheibacter lacus TaxID=2745851 RepID=A0A838ZTS9_9FLAO|nr:hypothetical protein [Moheibacter lacus]MBA5630339.1 hypothetical protein [Moheibacter lacus]